MVYDLSDTMLRRRNDRGGGNKDIQSNFTIVYRHWALIASVQLVHAVVDILYIDNISLVCKKIAYCKVNQSQ